jgi:hypothetical protein
MRDNKIIRKEPTIAEQIKDLEKKSAETWSSYVVAAENYAINDATNYAKQYFAQTREIRELNAKLLLQPVAVSTM